MGALLTLKTFITPKIINVIYWISTGLIILSGLVIMVNAASNFGVIGFLVGFFFGLIFMVLGWLYTRVLLEVIAVLFRINSNLTAIRIDKKM